MERNKRTYSGVGKNINNNNSISQSCLETDEIVISRVVLSSSPQISKKLKSDNDKSKGNYNIDRERRVQHHLHLPQTSSSKLDGQYRSLEPGQMLNDTVVEYYLNHLLNAENSERFHIFSTFFYAKIKTLQKSNGNDLDQSIMRWDKQVKLFDKDYIVIPICDCKHWVLVIVCFAHKLPAQEKPSVINEPASRTQSACVLIFDSLGYKYLSKFTDPIRNFLNLRWQYERPKDEKRNFKDRKTFMDIHAKVPRQRNTYDCGVYLLHYFEKFVKNPLATYAKVKEGKDLTSEWIMNPTTKRESIKLLILRQNKSSVEDKGLTL